MATLNRMHLRQILLLTVLALFFATSLSARLSPPPVTDAMREEAASLVSQMTLEEKIDMVSGINYMEMRGSERLGIPRIRLSNGPHGARPWKTPNYAYAVADDYRRATCFPAAVGMAASFDTELLEEVGSVVGREANDKGMAIIAGPCLNIVRNPFGGRNFESYGEDPHLAGEMAVAFVNGVQREGVMATIKHFVANNQEIDRFDQSISIPERALREIYLPAYRDAVLRARSASVMTAYPRVNGAFCSESGWLLNGILKGEWGFDGFVMSDWGAVHSSIPTVLGGLDIEMPSGEHLNRETLLPAIESGQVPESTLDEMIVRRLQTMMRFGLFDPDRPRNDAFDTPAHRELTRQASEDGMVLLKNEGQLLPLDASSLNRIAVIGPSAEILRMGGGGSSTVPPLYTVSPLEGLTNYLPEDCEITYARGFRMKGDVFPVEPQYLSHEDGKPGLKAEYYPNKDWSGEPAITRIDSRIAFDWGEEDLGPDLKAHNYSVRWTGQITAPESGRYLLSSLHSGGPMEVRFDGEWIIGERKIETEHDLIAMGEAAHAEGEKAVVEMEAGVPYDIEVIYAAQSWKCAAVLGWEPLGGDLEEEALAAAEGADAVLFFAGISHNYESEGWDLESIEIDPAQVSLLEKIARVNPDTVVILHNGTPLLLTDWIDKVPAVLEAWYTGQEGGNAIARVLLGQASPGGRLPMSFPASWEDCPASATYPPEDGRSIAYEEGIMVGYRHYLTEGIEPLFPFGFGLSYTRFAYNDLELSSGSLWDGSEVTVSLTVTNVGEKTGSDVVQLYVRDIESSVLRPIRELKGFAKVHLQPGESQRVTLTLKPEDLAFWDVASSSFVTEPGTFAVEIGASSADIRLSENIEFIR